MTDAENALAALEQRVREKLIAANQAAHPEWADIPDPMESWTSPLPADWPQFPRERWMIRPAHRAMALILANKLIDQGKLAEAGALVQYGGKERIA